MSRDLMSMGYDETIAKLVHSILIDSATVDKDGRYLTPVDDYGYLFSVEDSTDAEVLAARLSFSYTNDFFNELVACIPRWAMHITHHTVKLTSAQAAARLVDELRELKQAHAKHGWMNINTILELVDVLFYAKYIDNKNDDIVFCAFIRKVIAGMVYAVASARDEHTPIAGNHYEDIFTYLNVAAALKFAISRRSVKFPVDDRWRGFKHEGTLREDEE